MTSFFHNVLPVTPVIIGDAEIQQLIKTHCIDVNYTAINITLSNTHDLLHNKHDEQNKHF